eukprot:347586-Pelagomonas_calceolata.AAC.1
MARLEFHRIACEPHADSEVSSRDVQCPGQGTGRALREVQKRKHYASCATGCVRRNWAQEVKVLGCGEKPVRNVAYSKHSVWGGTVESVRRGKSKKEYRDTWQHACVHGMHEMT